MNANTLITNSMTLEEKLAIIDEMVANTTAKVVNGIQVAIDPASLLVCDSCQ